MIHHYIPVDDKSGEEGTLPANRHRFQSGRRHNRQRQRFTSTPSLILEGSTFCFSDLPAWLDTRRCVDNLVGSVGSIRWSLRNQPRLNPALTTNHEFWDGVI
ncbi:hypothetical protein OK016_16420 [Vibrio chagasii]|nr:hypothetical protein [Vibrio chagasii]